jgi:hypothetical protein
MTTWERFPFIFVMSPAFSSGKILLYLKFCFTSNSTLPQILLYLNIFKICNRITSDHWLETTAIAYKTFFCLININLIWMEIKSFDKFEFIESFIQLMIELKIQIIISTLHVFQVISLNWLQKWPFIWFLV